MTNVDWVNEELISFADLEGIAHDSGYKDRMELYYKYPGNQSFKQIVSNQQIVEMFEIFRRIRAVNIYICEVDPVALKVVHPYDSDYSDVGEESEHYEFSEGQTNEEGEKEQSTTDEEGDKEMGQTDQEGEKETCQSAEEEENEANRVLRIQFSHQEDDMDRQAD